MSLRFKNRIALFNTAAAAITTLLVFIVLYLVVYYSAYRHLDSDLRMEQEEVFAGIHWKGDSLILELLPERLEKEHSQAEVSPVFLQVVDSKGQLVFRSANLQDDHLLFADSLTSEIFINVDFAGNKIRQGQFPIINDTGKLLGHLVVGISREESVIILSNLLLTLCLAFPLMLLVFYLATSWAASHGIAPVHKLIDATGMISDNNISTRIPLPSRRDEIHQLATTINELLDRIEKSLTREKQITADISHELRTPITSIRGTLEVLIRKAREPKQYEEKIEHVIGEVDSMTTIIDQLLQLSRLDAGNLTMSKTDIKLKELLLIIKERWSLRLNEKNIVLQIDIPEGVTVHADHGFLLIILENLVSNAIKYSQPSQPIDCFWNAGESMFMIRDHGIGIPQDQIPYLFDRFYRTDSSRSSQVQGNGLGLAIAKNLAGLLQITIGVSSQTGTGTTFSLQFPS